MGLELLLRIERMKSFGGENNDSISNNCTHIEVDMESKMRVTRKDLLQ